MLHGTSLYEEVVHVPLMVKHPFQRRGETVEHRVSLVDLVPTILEAAGLQAGGLVDGRSLRAGGASSSRKIFSEGFFNRLSPKPLWRDQTAVYSGALKFIFSSNGQRELYDLASDPREHRNLFSRDPAAAEMERVVHQWLKGAQAVSAPVAKPDPATLERLRSLGYLQ